MAGLSRLYRAEKGFGDVDSAEQMEQVLRRTVPVSRGDLAELARRRAAAVHEALMRLGVDGSRLYVVSEGEQAVTSTGSGRVRLQVLS
jgi:outer membrane protein OmpA-like peptidoglycan-associated protein